MSNRATKGRNIPSWMSEEDKQTQKSIAPTASTSSTDFSDLLEGVVFVLSGFVNPERATLRSQALEMGAEYRPDWSSDCTLLVCAYSNTPKFRQVESDCGTIVKKDWILECYKRKKLVEIDSYLMHAGRPWRKSNATTKNVFADVKPSPPTKSEKQVERGSLANPTTSSSSKTKASSLVKEYFPPSKVKKWAIDDLNRTITWLESQEEKPESSEIKQIAAEGIIICLQDARDFLEQNQDVRQVTQQWNVVPHAVEELIKLVDDLNCSAPHSQLDLCKQAKACKQIYEAELKNVDEDFKKKKLKTEENERPGNGRTDDTSKNSAVYDSDETIEMTEEEINCAYNAVASKLCN